MVLVKVEKSGQHETGDICQLDRPAPPFSMFSAILDKSIVTTIGDNTTLDV